MFDIHESVWGMSRKRKRKRKRNSKFVHGRVDGVRCVRDRKTNTVVFVDPSLAVCKNWINTEGATYADR